MSESLAERRSTRQLRLAARLCALGIVLAVSTDISAARAFDRAGYKARAEATLAELNAKRLVDSKATLARLDEMIAIGVVAMKEFGDRKPKYAGLMNAAVADAPAMKAMTDAEIEDKWGETGTGGDAVGVKLSSLAEFGEERAYLELVVAPSEQYLLIKKWEATKKARWLEEARDDAVELLRHLDSIPADKK